MIVRMIAAMARVPWNWELEGSGCVLIHSPQMRVLKSMRMESPEVIAYAIFILLLLLVHQNGVYNNVDTLIAL